MARTVNKPLPSLGTSTARGAAKQPVVSKIVGPKRATVTNVKAAHAPMVNKVPVHVAPKISIPNPATIMPAAAVEAFKAANAIVDKPVEKVETPKEKVEQQDPDYLVPDVKIVGPSRKDSVSPIYETINDPPVYHELIEDPVYETIPETPLIAASNEANHLPINVIVPNEPQQVKHETPVLVIAKNDEDIKPQIKRMEEGLPFTPRRVQKITPTIGGTETNKETIKSILDTIAVKRAELLKAPVTAQPAPAITLQIDGQKDAQTLTGNYSTSGKDLTIVYTTIPSKPILGSMTRVEGNLTITTSVNGFVSNAQDFRALNTITGTLTITGAFRSIPDFSALTNLGNLVINNTTNMVSLQVFTSLKEITGSILITNNTGNLKAINGFSNLTSVNGDITISNNKFENSAKSNLNICSNLTTVKNVYIENNAHLREINGFHKVESIINIGIKDTESASIVRVNIFKALKTVTGSIMIKDTSALKAIGGFEMVETVESADINPMPGAYFPMAQKFTKISPNVTVGSTKAVKPVRKIIK